MLAASACAGDVSTSDGDGDTTSIVGSTWILDAASAEALIDEVVPAEALATIRFQEDGTVGGSSGCNTFGGTYAAGADGSLSIQPGA